MPDAVPDPTADAPRCKRCGLPVVVERAMYETFEGMHWLCFHLEFEHGDDRDPDEACDDPSCPWNRIMALESGHPFPTLGLIASFRNATGRKLERVYGGAFAFEGRIHDDDPMSVWFAFAGLPAFGIRGCGHGEGLRIDERPPEPCDMQDAGEQVVRDFLRPSLLGPVGGRVLDAAWEVDYAQPLTPHPIGIRLDFEGGPQLLIYNLGDQIAYRWADFEALYREWELIELRPQHQPEDPGGGL